MGTPSIHISKIEAAKRQLETAIVLYFSNADVVSIHTLSSASHGIINDLCKLTGIKSTVKDLDMVKKEKQKEYCKLVNSASNFFKHADKDPDILYEFIPNSTDFFIFDACRMYQQLTNEVPKLMHIFSLWFYLNEPDIICDDTQVEKEFLLKNRNSFYLHNRTNFFHEVSNGYDVIFAKRVTVSHQS